MLRIVSTIVCLQLVNGKFISPDVGLGRSGYGGFKYTKIGYDPSVDYHHGLGTTYEYHGHHGIDAPYESEIGYSKIGGYGGEIGVPKAAGVGYGYGPEFGIKPVFDEYGHWGNVYGNKYGRVGYKGDVGLSAVQYPGLYPSAIGLNPKIGYGYGHHYPPFTHHIDHGLGYGHKELGGADLEKSIYSDGKKNIAGEHFVKSHGQNGDTISHGDQGYKSDKVAIKDAKGDSVHFIDTDGGNQAHHDGKEYHGGEHFAKEGESGSKNHEKQGHRKGHNIKGFKKSHHLDETGKTEEYFDEVHDEGGNYAFDGHSGKFGETGGSSFKGGLQDGKYSAGENKKEGYYDNKYVVDKEHAGSGNFGGKKYANNEEVYGVNKELGAHDLSGHHEYDNTYKKYPYYH